MEDQEIPMHIFKNKRQCKKNPTEFSCFDDLIKNYVYKAFKGFRINSQSQWTKVTTVVVGDHFEGKHEVYE